MDCEIIRCGDGIAIDDSGSNVIVGNTVRFSRRSGISLVQSDDNTITRNLLSDNTLAGLTVGQGTTGNQIYLNSFKDETNAYAGDTASWVSSEPIAYIYEGRSYNGLLGNYWIGYSGSDGDGNGVGERPFTFESAKGDGALKPSAQSRRDQYPLVKPLASYTITAGDRFVESTSTIPSTDAATTTVSTGTAIAQTPATTASDTTAPGEVASAEPLDMTPLFQLIVVIALAGAAGFALVVIRRRGNAARHNSVGEAASTSPMPGVDRTSTTLAASPDAAIAVSSNQTFFFPAELTDKYQGIEYIGKGGIARIYRATRKSDGQRVAIKIPINFDELTGISFMKEIKVWEGLRHPNIVEISGGNILPLPYFEMEYLPSSLDHEVLPMRVCEATRIVDGIAQGLAYAHQRGVVHRDLKPQNILLTTHRIPKISDWGLSKVMTDGADSQIGGFSPIYAAPEQISPKRYGPTDARTDIYQVGVLFYELVTGRAPAAGDSIAEIISSILDHAPVDPSSLNAEATAVEPIILKCLEKDPAARYASADALHRDLETYLKTCEKVAYEPL
jgi:parallel beta-helix repeat protein